MVRRRLVGVLILGLEALVGAGCALEPPVRVPQQRHEGRAPPLDEQSRVVIGGVLYTEYHYIMDPRLPLGPGFAVGTMSSSRKELVYLGRTEAGAVDLLYREYGEDLIMPSFSERAAYPLDHRGRGVITSHGVEIEVLEAAADGTLTYRVRKGF